VIVVVVVVKAKAKSPLRKRKDEKKSMGTREIIMMKNPNVVDS